MWWVLQLELVVYISAHNLHMLHTAVGQIVADDDQDEDGPLLPAAANASDQPQLAQAAPVLPYEVRWSPQTAFLHHHL